MGNGEGLDTGRPEARAPDEVDGPSPAMVASSVRIAAAAARALGNPLSVISGRADMIVSGEVIDAHDVRASAEIIRAQTTRLERLVEELRLFGAPPEPRPVRTDVFAMIRRVLSDVEKEPWGSSLRTSVSCESRKEAWAEVDPAHVSEALRRIVQNAAEAMPSGGALSVDVARERRPSDHARGERGTEWVRILVHDVGPGISAEQRDRLFEPFHTTKPWSDGLGLGLAIARRLVVENGGLITVGSAVDEGTTVRIYLPPSEQR